MDQSFENGISKMSGFRMFPVSECPVFASLLYYIYYNLKHKYKYVRLLSWNNFNKF